MKNVKVYYGIPYGKDPSGVRRWQKTEAAESVRNDFSQKEEVAVQMKNRKNKDGNPVREVIGTSDCLNLDVYTYDGASGKPVFVYIHGGNNQTGSSFEIRGNELVEQADVVFVSVNFRLGLLGFNCLPALVKGGKSGNYTLYDIAEALRWVRKNIAEYGGDPANVTVSGFSAGGRNVMAILTSSLFEGLFDKAVVFSGGMTMPDPVDSARQIAYSMAKTVIEDGKACDEESAVAFLLQDSEEVREYLYGLTEDRIVAVGEHANIRMAKFPHLFADGITLPEEGFRHASYVNDVPVMMLTGDTEFSMFAAFDPYFSSLKAEKEDARNFAVKYGSDFYRIFNTQLSALHMKEDGYLSDIYAVQINYGGEHSASSIPVLGSFHGIFVPMLDPENMFATVADFSKAGYRNMADLFLEKVRNFLYTGKPDEGEWKPWTIEEKNTLVLDADETSGTVSAVVQDVYKSNAEIICEMEADHTIGEDIKEVIIRTILNGRWFSEELDAHYRNPSLWENR